MNFRAEGRDWPFKKSEWCHEWGATVGQSGRDCSPERETGRQGEGNGGNDQVKGWIPVLVEDVLIMFLKVYFQFYNNFYFCRSWLEKLRLSEERKVEESKQLEVCIVNCILSQHLWKWAIVKCVITILGLYFYVKMYHYHQQKFVFFIINVFREHWIKV